MVSDEDLLNLAKAIANAYNANVETLHGFHFIKSKGVFGLGKKHFARVHLTQDERGKHPHITLERGVSYRQIAHIVEEFSSKLGYISVVEAII